MLAVAGAWLLIAALHGRKQEAVMTAGQRRGTARGDAHAHRCGRGQRLLLWTLTLRRRRLQHAVQRFGEVAKLREVGRRQALHQPVALVCEEHPHHTGVFLVLLAADDAGVLRAVDQAHRAVTLQQQVIGKIADRRRLRPWMSFDRDEHLVLCGRQARRSRLVLTPVQEPPQRHAEPQAVLEILFGRLNRTDLLTNRSLP
jgi:hypothetical protein